MNITKNELQSIILFINNLDCRHMTIEEYGRYKELTLLLDTLENRRITTNKRTYNLIKAKRQTNKFYCQ